MMISRVSSTKSTAVCQFNQSPSLLSPWHLALITSIICSVETALPLMTSSTISKLISLPLSNPKSCFQIQNLSTELFYLHQRHIISKLELRPKPTNHLSAFPKHSISPTMEYYSLLSRVLT